MDLKLFKYLNLCLQNYGNTCYLNASLQCLLGLPMVVTDVLNSRQMVDMKGKVRK